MKTVGIIFGVLYAIVFIGSSIIMFSREEKKMPDLILNLFASLLWPITIFVVCCYVENERQKNNKKEKQGPLSA